MDRLFTKGIRYLSAVSLFLFFFCFNGMGQSLMIKGKITNDAGEPMPGAIIVVKGTSIGTTSDASGFYKISSPSMTDTLAFSFLGYEKQVIAIHGSTTINVQLKANARSMNEVVVVGMSNRQTKRSITGAVSTIEARELKQSPVANLSNALAGRLPGLITVQETGEPGNDAAKMYIRGIGTYGNTTPLIVIDGLPRTLADFEQLDPNEIASVSILKDAASASLYGIQGANGVIVVTTRRGGSNQTPQISFTAQQAVQQPVRLPKMMGTYEQALFYKDLDQNNGQPQQYTDQVLQAIKNNSEPYLYPNVNWFSTLLKKYASQNQYNLNISGSTNNLRYFVSGSYIDQGTLLKYGKDFERNYSLRTKFNRYNFRSNIDLDATPTLHLRVDLAGRLEDQIGPNQGFSNLFEEITQRSPSAAPVHNPNGTLGAGSLLQIPYHQNLLGMITQGGYYANYTNDMYGTLSATQDLNFITKGLSAQVFFSFEDQNFQSTVRSQNFNSYWYQGINSSGDSMYQQVGIFSHLATSGANSIERDNYLDFRVNYRRVLGNNAIVGQIRADRSLKLINDSLPYAYQGLSGHFTYSYKSKYYGDIDIGYNGSENFPPHRRYGFFPAISAGWVVSSENFLKDVTWLSFLKVRASYGLVGNDQIGGERFLYISDFAPGGGYEFGITPSSVPGYNENRVGNELVTWEHSTKSDIGINLSLFRKNNVQFSFDVFQEMRRDILTPPESVPDFIGIVNLAPLNSGIVRNRGYDGELKLTWNIGKSQWFSNLQLSYAKNTVLQNDQPTPLFPYQDLRGYSVGYVLGYKATGLFKDQDEINKSPKQTFSSNLIPGDIKYTDVNHDGVIDPNDRVPIPMNEIPDYTGGISLGASYKGFDFSVLFNGTLGGTAYVSLYDGDPLWLQRFSSSNPNPGTKIPVAHSSLNNEVLSTFFIEKTDYIKLRNAEIGYEIPQRVLKPIRLQYARVYINGQNLITWDKLWLKDRDPESAGQGFVNYPLLRILNIGINIKF